MSRLLVWTDEACEECMPSMTIPLLSFHADITIDRFVTNAPCSALFGSPKIIMAIFLGQLEYAAFGFRPYFCIFFIQQGAVDAQKPGSLGLVTQRLFQGKTNRIDFGFGLDLLDG